MGRTVYGVDLEESPFGGLIEKLLTEEELEKIADGGAPARPGGRPTAPDGGDDGDDGSGDDAESDSDAGDEDDWTVSDDTCASKGDADGNADDASADDAGSGASDAESWSPSSPPPSTDPGDSHDLGTGSGYGGSTDFGAGAGPDASDDDGGSFLSKHKWLLLKVAVGLAALAAVALVVWRFKDRLAGAVPGRGGDDDADEFDGDGPGTDETGDVSPARRRAKVDESAPDAGEDWPGEGRDEAAEGRPRRDPVEGVETPGQDLDLGALVGLGMLAFVAALVRKYDEERTRPHDPLVDGPRGDEVMDDDQ